MNPTTLIHPSNEATELSDRRLARRRALAWWTFALLVLAVLSLVGF